MPELIAHRGQIEDPGGVARLPAAVPPCLKERFLDEILHVVPRRSRRRGDESIEPRIKLSKERRRIGTEFDGIVTGASSKGTWARIFEPPAEGRIERGQEGLDVGDRVRVKLVHTDPEHGFIDFARVAHVPVGPRRG